MYIPIPWLACGALVIYALLFIIYLRTGQPGKAPALDIFFYPALAILMYGIRFIVFPIALIAAWGNDFIFDIRNRWYIRKARWIAAKLAENGITVSRCDYDWLHECCAVEADVPSEKTEAYRLAYAEAIWESCRRWSPREICGSAMPREPLNRDWAISIGITEYFKETFLFCIQCNAPHSMGFRWGDDIFHTDPFVNFRTKTDYHFTDGSVKTIEGHLCGECQKKTLGAWKFSSTYLA